MDILNHSYLSIKKLKKEKEEHSHHRPKLSQK